MKTLNAEFCRKESEYQVKRRHEMPFSATVIEDGGVRFRLWAPSVPSVRLCIDGIHSAEFPMQAVADGWHVLELDNAGPSTRYRFLLPDGKLVPDPASRFNPDDVQTSDITLPLGNTLFTTSNLAQTALSDIPQRLPLPPWSVAWILQEK